MSAVFELKYTPSEDLIFCGLLEAGRVTPRRWINKYPQKYFLVIGVYWLVIFFFRAIETRLGVNLSSEVGFLLVGLLVGWYGKAALQRVYQRKFARSAAEAGQRELRVTQDVIELRERGAALRLGFVGLDRISSINGGSALIYNSLVVSVPDTALPEQYDGRSFRNTLRNLRLDAVGSSA
ncbi:hypothetical protein [Thalassococcus lentus]|uniref:YcxB-like protein domain-containing protein n=1 Tax=Thalassococcus lentus TaxID=1210524 RepID=A0ABT4XT18_9RHOB|nr:hypothetical protein [Thalassococcus lentus]MDA7424978.1 hypothetical protein [Thalassococcus lentus]